MSAFFHQHSVSKMITRLVTALPRSLFHVSVFRYTGPDDAVVNEVMSVSLLLTALRLRVTRAVTVVLLTLRRSQVDDFYTLSANKAPSTFRR